MSGGISIEIKTSFEAHSEHEKRCIYQLYAEAKKAKNAFLLNITELAKQRGALPSLLAYYKDKLGKTNPACFAFLTEQQKLRLKNELIYTYYLIYAQYQIDKTEDRRYTLEGISARYKEINHQQLLALCAQRIKELDTTGVAGQQAPPEVDLEANIDLANQCLKFIGLTQIARWFVEKFKELMDNHSGTLVEWMSEVNGRRLYWVWGGGMLATIFDMLPNDFFNKLEAQANLAAPSPITGYMSWVLYYTRFGINLLLLLKHTFYPTKEECHIPRWERFKTQWNQRKFALLNDSIWGFANMLCFFWLKGSGMLGYAGNLLTVGLLLMDLVLTTWRFYEEATKHNADMEALNKDKEQLKRELQGNITPARREAINAELKNIEKMEIKATFDWKYKKYGLINDWTYALALMVAFSIMCCFFFPPTAVIPASVLVIGVVGSALCFVFTAITAAVSGALEVAKSKEISKLERDNCQGLLKLFTSETDPKRKRILFLEMKTALAESDYQQRVARIQMVKMVRAVLVDTLIPPVVFMSLIFMPIGVGLGVLAAGFVLAVITYAIINRFEPESAQLPSFNEDEYKEFESNPTLGQLEYTPERESLKGWNLLGWMKPSEGYLILAKDSEADFGEATHLVSTGC